MVRTLIYRFIQTKVLRMAILDNFVEYMFG